MSESGERDTHDIDMIFTNRFDHVSKLLGRRTRLRVLYENEAGMGLPGSSRSLALG